MKQRNLIIISVILFSAFNGDAEEYSCDGWCELVKISKFMLSVLDFTSTFLLSVSKVLRLKHLLAICLTDLKLSTWYNKMYRGGDGLVSRVLF